MKPSQGKFAFVFCFLLVAMAAGMSVEAMLRSIHVVRCYDATEQAAAIAALPEFIQNNPKVCVCV